MTAPRTRPWEPGALEAVLTIAALALAIGVLVLLGRGPLAGPDRWTAAAVEAWLARPDATLTVLATVRLAALAIASYCCLVATVELMGRLARRPDLVRLAQRLTLPPLRRSVTAVAGITLSSVTLVVAHSSLPAPAEDAAGPPVTLERLPDEGPSGRAATMGPPQAPDATWADAAESADPRPAPAPAPTPPARSEAVAPAADPLAPRGSAAPREWRVAPGDHLWGIAEATLAESWGRPPSDAEVLPHWQALVERNRERLVDPDAPDLLLPGQVLEVPPPPPA